jgi:hypothetical protein
MCSAYVDSRPTYTTVAHAPRDGRRHLHADARGTSAAAFLLCYGCKRAGENVQSAAQRGRRPEETPGHRDIPQTHSPTRRSVRAGAFNSAEICGRELEPTASTSACADGQCAAAPSIGSAERCRKAYANIHCAKRSRLGPERAAKLICVHCNMRLGQMREDPTSEPVCLPPMVLGPIDAEADNFER